MFEATATGAPQVRPPSLLRATKMPLFDVKPSVRSVEAGSVRPGLPAPRKVAAMKLTKTCPLPSNCTVGAAAPWSKPSGSGIVLVCQVAPPSSDSSTPIPA